MTKYIRITEKIVGKLNAKEAYLFYCLALNADLVTYESNIKQETLAKEYGIKDTDQISDWLYKFQSCGLLTISKSNIKGKYGTFQRCRYKLDTEHYVFITEVLKDEPINRQLKGFLILLKCTCLNGTNSTLYSQNQLAKELGLGVNAGHDLSLENLAFFNQNIPWLEEVSIGHALICDALYLGLKETITQYKNCLIQK